jgi:hypothetical protein
VKSEKAKVKSLHRVKPNSEKWNQHNAVSRAGASCSYGKTRHGSFSSVLQLLLTFLFCLFTLIALTACEESFSPMQHNDQYPFSIHGYLDASQDTNWVRITAVRDSLFLEEPAPLDAVVTLEHIESGESAVMNDSLFRYEGGYYAHNYWTDMKLEPEQSYKLTVQRSDGAESRAAATLPPDFPLPQIRPGRFNRDTLVVHGVQHLADVRVLYDVDFHYSEISTSDDVLNTYNFSHLADTLRGFHYHQRRIMIDVSFHLNAFFMGPIPYTINKNKITVFAAGPEWIRFSGLDENLISLPEGASNIEGGSGYLIGVISKTIPGSRHPP